MADDKRERTGARTPVRRQPGERQQLAHNDVEAVLTATRDAPAPARLPMPEFLSLTYTLPYHLVAQLDRLGQLTNRSQSELVAESIRLYLKAYAARREHTRISTVEGFSYQQVAVAEAGVEDDWNDEDAPPSSDAAAAIEPIDVPEPPAAVEAAPAEEQASEAARDSTAAEAPLPPATPTPPPPPPQDAAPETEPEPELQFPSTVTLALDQLEATDQIADPAAEVRRRLRKLADEPRDSMRLRSALEDIMRDVDVKDFSLSNHSVSVASLSKRLGEAKGISGVSLDEIYLAGLLHDIGKASIPDDILQKRRPTPEEMSVIRQYPLFGADLLSLLPALQGVAAIVATHQERWNGSGYPDGLQGNDIPVGAQIVAICDVYQVLTTQRRYRAAYDEERARQIIQESSGSLWSPELARVFLNEVIARERIV